MQQLSRPRLVLPALDEVSWELHLPFPVESDRFYPTVAEWSGCHRENVAFKDESIY